jgi:NAD(P)-dependent dehydrogenase (short-subunit alcohol dehydrogenase family)
MKKYKIAVLDDYQNVALESADWSVLRDRADIAVFHNHVADPDALIERLLPFDVVCVMRERTPLPRNIIERLPNLKLIASTGSVNGSIDIDAAGDQGIAVVYTGYRPEPTIELTWALILAAARHIVAESNSVRSGGWQQTVGMDLRGKTLGVQGDVANLADLDRLYETVGKVKGRIDIIFANAGVGEFVPFGKVSEEHFDRLFNINVKGALFTVQKGLPLLNDGGSIILTGSVASVKGTPAFGVYAASKAAIRSFVRTWTTDLKDRHIRSNVVSPGPIKTPLTLRQYADVIARIVSTVPMGRMGEADEVAKAALYLASDDSSFVTGVELFVDGGRAQV